MASIAEVKARIIQLGLSQYVRLFWYSHREGCIQNPNSSWVYAQHSVTAIGTRKFPWLAEADAHAIPIVQHP